MGIKFGQRIAKGFVNGLAFGAVLFLLFGAAGKLGMVDPTYAGPLGFLFGVGTGIGIELSKDTEPKEEK